MTIYQKIGDRYWLLRLTHRWFGRPRSCRWQQVFQTLRIQWEGPCTSVWTAITQSAPSSAAIIQVSISFRTRSIPMTAKLDFQTVTQKQVTRAQHIWAKDNGHWKCVLCGAVTKRGEVPPPTDSDWMPDRYEDLTDEDRNLAPYDGGVRA